MKKRICIALLALSAMLSCVGCKTEPENVDEKKDIQDTAKEEMDTTGDATESTEAVTENLTETEADTEENEYWQESDNIKEDGTYMEPMYPEILASIPKKYISCQGLQYFSKSEDHTLIMPIGFKVCSRKRIVHNRALCS